jgi:predicted aspartyl protease
MATFNVNLEIGDSKGEVWETVDASVDTDSTYTWIPSQLLERLAVSPQFHREFEMADGRIVERDLAIAMVRWDGETMPTLVVFGGATDAVLLGAYTLEGFALAPDLVNRRLVRVRGFAMGNVGSTLRRTERDTEGDT